VGANDRPVERTPSRGRRATRRGEAGVVGRVHIDADADLVIDDMVIDLRTEGGSEPPTNRLVVTTDIRCPNCAGTLRVDDFDRDLMAAQLTCIDCGFTYLQRLHAVRAATLRPLPHRKLREDHPVDRRSPEEREQTIRAGADYFWSG
jgi:hypothetical protein